MGSALRRGPVPGSGDPGPCTSQQAGQGPSRAGPGSVLPQGAHRLPSPLRPALSCGWGVASGVLLGGPQEVLGSVPGDDGTFG